ncbi:MAG: spore coat associated protein CotJA [bacterium]|nr:spore coat associated protein CotJA [bacterium]
MEQSENFTVGMAFVPMQNWERTYDLATGRKRGTIFPSLDLPFMMGRCR